MKPTIQEIKVTTQGYEYFDNVVKTESGYITDSLVAHYEIGPNIKRIYLNQLPEALTQLKQQKYSTITQVEKEATQTLKDLKRITPEINEALKHRFFLNKITSHQRFVIKTNLTAL